MPNYSIIFFFIIFITISYIACTPTIKSPKFNPWSFPILKRSDARNIKLVFLLSVITVETSSEIYVRVPQDIVYGSKPTPITNRNGADSMVIIFPGAGGVDENIEKLKLSIQKSDKSKKVSRYVEVYDWKKWSNDFVRIAFDSQSVGKTICADLAEKESAEGKIKKLQTIGVSIGAFAADSCIKTYNSNSESPGETRLTLLDPFTSKGIFGYGWGVKNFGKTANIVEDYLNSDDKVPTTNDPLELAYNYDVTESQLKKSFVPLEGESYHSWPVAYLSKVWKTETNEKGDVIFPKYSEFPKGIVYHVP